MKEFIIIILLITNLIANGQKLFNENDKNKIDSLFQKWNKNDSPGLNITIKKENELLYSANYGMASISENNQITNKTSFNLASLTKQFVAYSILLLEQKGKLKLDEKITSYLPEIKYKDLTVRHLLNHSSGIPEYWGIWSLSSFQGENIQDIYNILKNQTHRNFASGEKYQYSNSNYILLSLIIQKISGMSLTNFTKKYIFKKLGMKHTYFLNDSKKKDLYQAESYHYENGKYNIYKQKNSDIIGDGGLYSNSEDLLIWSDYFFKNIQINKDRKQVGIMNSGKESIYAAGLQKFSRGNLISYEHGGGTVGVSCYIAFFPQVKLSIIILANSEVINTFELYNQVNKVLFKNIIEKGVNTIQSNKDNSVSLDLKKVVGKYYGFASEIATTFTLSQINKDTLVGGTFGRPERKYISSGTNEIFCPDLPALKIKHHKSNLIISYMGNELGGFKKIKEKPNIELEYILGNYSSKEINNGKWTIFKEDEKMTATSPRSETFDLIDIGSNIYNLKALNLLLIFDKSSSSDQVSLKLVHGGAGEIVLTKLN